VLAAGAPLLVVELAFGEQPFRLGGIDGLLQLRSGDVIWQKEHLLNLGIARLLAEAWKKVAWLDADVVFESPDWAERPARAPAAYRGPSSRGPGRPRAAGVDATLGPGRRITS
jgi:hypothetical protein